MEIWKTIKYANNYKVSDLGNISNKKTGRQILVNYDRLKKTNKRARPGLINNDGKNKGYYLHRIVADHFIDNKNNLPEVNHIDGNFYNNTADNLEWISKQNNMDHANKNNLIKRYKRRVIITNKTTQEEQIFESVSKCAIYLGCGPCMISQTCNNNRRDKKYDMKYETINNNQDIDESNIIWKEYPECDKYLVSNTGQIKNKKTGRIMMGSKVNGYRFVNLFIDKNIPKMNRLIHRMVAITYLDNPWSKPVVNHKDTNILNNNLDNLEWVTYKENMNTKETKHNLKKGKNSRIILQICIESEQIINKFYGAIEVEDKLNIDSRNILRICNYYNNSNNYKNCWKCYKKKYIFIFEEDFKNKNISILCKSSLIKKQNPNIKAIVQYNKNSLVKIKEFKSIYEASIKLDVNHSGISQVCNYYKYSDNNRPKSYKLKSYKGYIFKFL